jgi:hypothetical protein
VRNAGFVVVVSLGALCFACQSSSTTGQLERAGPSSLADGINLEQTENDGGKTTCPTQLNIIAPGDEETIDTSQALDVWAELEDYLGDFGPVEVDFAIRDNEGNSTVIDQIPLDLDLERHPRRAYPHFFRSSWNPSSFPPELFPPGPYLLTVTAKVATCDPVVRTVPFTLTAAEALKQGGGCGCREMIIMSRAGSGRTSTYCLPARQDWAQWQSTVFAGCDRVTDPPPGTCPEGETPFNCRFGPISLAGPIVANRLALSFEVAARLDNNIGDNRNACRSGQLVRARHYWWRTGDRNARDEVAVTQATPGAGNLVLPGGEGGVTYTVRNRGSDDNRVPNFDPNPAQRLFGADAYTNDRWGVRALMRVSDSSIKWYDNPTIVTPPRIDFANVLRLGQRLQFLSYVLGRFANQMLETGVLVRNIESP